MKQTTTETKCPACTRPGPFETVRVDSDPSLNFLRCMHPKCNAAIDRKGSMKQHFARLIKVLGLKTDANGNLVL